MHNNNEREIYITKSTLMKISRDIESKNIYNEISILNSYSEKLNLEIDSLFSLPEILSIQKMESLLKSLSNGEELTVNKKNKQYKGTKTRLIYLTSTPSYHYDKNCKFLNSDYQNYEIPLEIEEKDIEEYRDFFKKNMDLFENHPDRFFARVEIKFNTKIKNIGILSGKNSGIQYFSESEHINAINKIKEDLEKMKDNNERGFKNNVYMPYRKVKEIMMKKDKKDNDHLALEINNAKYKIRNHLTELMIMSLFKGQFKFKEKTLVNLGVNACQHCGY